MGKMMTLKRFSELGLKLWIENDQLKVSGMSSIPEGCREEIRRYIRDHKTEIIGRVINHSELWRHCSGRADGFICCYYRPKQIAGDDSNNGYCSHPSGGNALISDLKRCPGKCAIKITEAKYQIQPMINCLNGRRCRHLNAPGGLRPICNATGWPVFDLSACPKDKWSRC
jgi:hypothetical protein